MKVLKLSSEPYSINFLKPFHFGDNITSERKGFIIKVHNDGITGTGDTAPFPEIGSERIEDVKEFLEREEIEVEINENNFYKTLQGISKRFSYLPALSHGIEQAVINYFEKALDKTFFELFGLQKYTPVNVNYVTGKINSINEAKSILDFCFMKGYSTIKIKGGHKDFDVEMKVIDFIDSEYSNKLKIRYDINAGWDFDDAKFKLKKLERYNIEYIEQPVKTKEELIELSKISRIRIAADESARNLDDVKYLTHNGRLEAIIIKPMIAGGIYNTLEMIKAIKSKSKSIISSSFESYTGWLNCVRCAALVDKPTAHGLGTIEYFREEAENKPITIKNGRVEI